MIDFQATHIVNPPKLPNDNQPSVVTDIRMSKPPPPAEQEPLDTLPPDLPEELARRIVPAVDYRRYDEILESIANNICTCKWLLTLSSSNVMFNDHFYDV